MTTKALTKQDIPELKDHVSEFVKRFDTEAPAEFVAAGVVSIFQDIGKQDDDNHKRLTRMLEFDTKTLPVWVPLYQQSRAVIDYTIKRLHKLLSAVFVQDVVQDDLRERIMNGVLYTSTVRVEDRFDGLSPSEIHSILDAVLDEAMGEVREALADQGAEWLIKRHAAVADSVYEQLSVLPVEQDPGKAYIESLSE